MARNILISRRDWMQEAVASISGGFWALPIANAVDPRPQFVAEATDNRDWGSTQFSFDLGYARQVGLFFFANLQTSPLGLMRLQVSLNSDHSAPSYDTGWTTSWPPDGSAPFGPNPWGELALTHVYMPDEYEKLGYPRLLIPPSVIACRYGKIEIRDSTAASPLRIGCFGACEVWQPPLNFTYGWSLTPVDESDVQRVPFGATYVTERSMRRRLNLGFPALPEDEVLSRSLGLALIKGRSAPLVAAPFPDDADNLEKLALYGLVSQDGAISNPFVGHYAQPFQIDQLI